MRQKITEEDQHEELPENQPDRVVDQRYQRHCHCTREVGNNAGPLEAQAVHDRSDDARPDGRKQKGSTGESGLGGTARSLQDKPRDGHKRHDVPGLGDRVCAEQSQDRSAPRRPSSTRKIIHYSLPYHSLDRRRFQSQLTVGTSKCA